MNEKFPDNPYDLTAEELEVMLNDGRKDEALSIARERASLLKKILRDIEASPGATPVEDWQEQKEDIEADLAELESFIEKHDPNA